MELSTATQWGDRGGSVLPASAVRAVLTLAREAAEIHDPREEQAHMLGGICAIVGADVGVIFEFAGVGGVPTGGCLHGLSAAEQQKVVHAYAAQGDGFDLMATRMRQEFAVGSEPVLTCGRGELVADREWYRSSYVSDFRRSWGIDHCVYSIARVGRGYVGMSVNRPFGGAPFGDEARELVRIFQSEQGWLARLRAARAAPAPAPRPMPAPDLSPRARDVLAGLLRGSADKEIAAALGLSLHTVRQYVKTIYRAYGVTSRAELLARHHGAR
ncbi:MAG: helix-turn-helix transcriptional regulator [Byssovorax sp.]